MKPVETDSPGSAENSGPPDGEDHTVRVIELTTADSSGLIATGIASPRLSWRLESSRCDVRQLGYQVEAAKDPIFTVSLCRCSFVTSSSPLHQPWPFVPLASREVCFCRVQIWTSQGRTVWSAPLRIEAGLLLRQDWLARPISSGPTSRGHSSAVYLLRRAFWLDQPVVQARLYVTALGVHATSINGVRVSEDLLEPGWTAYQERLLYAAYEVTHLLRPGENVIAATLGEGWWARSVKLDWISRTYGQSPALLAQLEVCLADGSLVSVVTDETWRLGTGALRCASLFDGVEVDLRSEPGGWQCPGFDDHRWDQVVAKDLPVGLEMRSAPPVRVIENWVAAPARTARGTWLVDTGQNLTGYLRLRVRASAGATITVRHAEVLDGEGRLFAAALRSAKATDQYTLASDAPVVLEPMFTYHGFRYAEILTDSTLTIDEITIVVVASDLTATGFFECSDARVNKLFENVRWSQRGNFLAVPTDCPQRDERLGWTGDIQVFAQAACTNADVRAFLESWLTDLAIEQRADGQISSVVPNVACGFDWEYGRAGWGDAATVVPWALYEAYGDREVLQRQFQSMRGWVDWCASRRGTDGTWSGDLQFGDWLDPNAPITEPGKATTHSDYIASSFLSFSARIVARVALLLGQKGIADSYAGLSASVAAATWQRWRGHALSTQTGCAIALELDIAPVEERAGIASNLAQLVENASGKIGTGFLGTPLVLFALTHAGQIEAAYRLLLNTQCPGWLYPVLQGATTMWERWDAILPGGRIHAGQIAGFEAGMLSFNHYAFGAVAAWLYRSLAGLAPTANEPGYGTVIFAPLPGGGLNYARARVLSPYGPTSIAWALHGPCLEVDLEIPPGACGWFVPPPGRWHMTSQGRPLILKATPEEAPRLGQHFGSGQYAIQLVRYA